MLLAPISLYTASALVPNLEGQQSSGLFCITWVPIVFLTSVPLCSSSYFSEGSFMLPSFSVCDAAIPFNLNRPGQQYVRIHGCFRFEYFVHHCEKPVF